MVSDPYEELISAMETAILTMRKPAYFNDWKSVGFVDLAQVSDYPSALVEILPDIVADEQSCVKWCEDFCFLFCNVL